MEDCKEKYEQAIERAKSAIKECGDNKVCISIIKSIFPELKESEDERIRKLICSSIKEEMPIISPKNKELALAWLEKQGELPEGCVRKQVAEAKEALYTAEVDSEDEKTRKELLKFLEGIWHLGKNAPLEKWDKSDCSKWIAWLEKRKDYVSPQMVADAYLRGCNDTEKKLLEKQGGQKPLYINTPLINKMVNES